MRQDAPVTPTSDFHLVGWLILRRADRVLLARRWGVSYAAGHWALPGGHVEAGETLAEAASREAWEEIGVRTDPGALSPIGMDRYVDGEMAGVDLFFTATEFEGEPRPVAECDQVAWCRLDQLPDPVVPWLPATLQRHLVDGVWFHESLG
jgi:8-oxo-dGTP diphosphatase